MSVAIHLVDEKEHGDIELNAKPACDVGNAVKSVRVATAEVYRHHVALGLLALHHKSLLPR